MKTSTTQSYYQRIHRVLEYVIRHLDGDLSTQTLARVAHFSPFHFHRLFSAVVGETLGDFIQRIRLEVAADCLKQSTQAIAFISSRCGYESAEAFSRAFRRAYGVPPSVFRKRHTLPLDYPVQSRAVFDVERMAIRFVPNIENLKMHIEILKKPAVKYAYIGHIGPYHEITGAFNALFAWTEKVGVDLDHAEVFSQSYDNPKVTPTAELRSEACVSVEIDLAVDGDVKIRQQPAQRYAVYTLTGALSGIAGAYEKMLQQLVAGGGEELEDLPFVEVCKNNYNLLPEEAWLTELCIPLK